MGIDRVVWVIIVILIFLFLVIRLGREVGRVEG